MKELYIPLCTLCEKTRHCNCFSINMQLLAVKKVVVSSLAVPVTNMTMLMRIIILGI